MKKITSVFVPFQLLQTTGEWDELFNFEMVENGVNCL